MLQHLKNPTFIHAVTHIFCNFAPLFGLCAKMNVVRGVLISNFRRIMRYI